MFGLLLAIIYLSFISLGLPDGLLGSAWPTMYLQFDVPLSYSGIVFGIISGGTVISSLCSDMLTRKLTTGKLTAISVLTTAIALFGFSISTSFIQLCLWAIPYGLGAGSVDAALNNYVAIHYKSAHMSWLHCMWGIGAMIGPYIMGQVLTEGLPYNDGYRIISIIQIILTAILFATLFLWKNKDENNDSTNEEVKPLTLVDAFRISGVKEVVVCFFCYCAVEQSAGLWAASYLTLCKGIDSSTAAGFASLFYIGITAGRALSGFVTLKFNDRQMIRIGEAILTFGVLLVLLPLPSVVSLIGFVVIGLGCAPIYPSIIHSTPDRFGKDRSQSIVGIQMASAYAGNLLMPPLFGIIANHISTSLLPVYLLILTVLMILLHEKLEKVTKK